MASLRPSEGHHRNQASSWAFDPKADDTGVLILADRRLLTKGYGKSFLNSLPSHTVKVRSADEIVAALEMLR